MNPNNPRKHTPHLKFISIVKGISYITPITYAQLHTNRKIMQNSVASNANILNGFMVLKDLIFHQ